MCVPLDQNLLRYQLAENCPSAHEDEREGGAWIIIKGVVMRRSRVGRLISLIVACLHDLNG